MPEAIAPTGTADVEADKEDVTAARGASRQDSKVARFEEDPPGKDKDGNSRPGSSSRPRSTGSKYSTGSGGGLLEPVGPVILEQDAPQEELVMWEGMRELPENTGADAAFRDFMMPHPLFEGCSTSLLESMSVLAKRIAVPDGEELPIEDNGVMYIVEQGALQVCVGLGPATMARAGSCFNISGMLGLHREAEAYKPRSQKGRETVAGTPHMEMTSPYEVLGYSGSAPNIFEFTDYGGSRCSTADDQERERVRTDLSGLSLSPNVRCFYNLCPQACANAGRKDTAASVDSGGPAPTPIGGPRKTQGGWLSFSAVGVDDADGNPTRLVRVPVILFDDLRSRHASMTDYDMKMRKSLDKFKANCKGCAVRWNSLMKHLSKDVFPAVPPDVLWAVAEISQSIVGEPGHNLVTEGEHDEAGESLLIIENGVGSVDKLMERGGSTHHFNIGRLRPGAIIGDIRFLGCSMPRPAAVRAKTRVEATLLPAKEFLGVLSRFPGMLEGCESSILSASAFMQANLPTRAEVLGSLKLFACCHMKFLATIGIQSGRQLYFCGQTIIEQASEQSMLYALEYGRCSVEVEGVGQVATLTMGQCFGERTLLGHSKTASATVRVQSPYVLALAVPQEALNTALERYEGTIESAHFEELRATAPGGQQKGGQLQNIELFRACSSEFCECLADSLHLVCFMPGQTVVVQGVCDDEHMYVVMGGSVSVERCGSHITDMKSGATFGELVMLDLSKTRSCTVRASTFCVLMEIPRTGFTAALGKFPADLAHFKGLDNRKEVIHWPCLRRAPDRLQYLLDLYADQRRAHEEDDIWTIAAAAILIIDGQATVVDENGTELEVLSVGQCRDFHYMLDLPDGEPITRLKPSSDCKVKLVTKEVWDKVLAEFPAEEENCKKLITEYSVQRSQEKLGFRPGSSEALRLSAVFRALSEPFVMQVVECLDNRMCTPGLEIIKPDQAELGMYLVLAGVVCVEDHRGQHKAEIGRVFGESVLLGVSPKYAYTVEAVSLCTVQFLEKTVFDEIIQTMQEDYRVVSFLQREALENGGGGDHAKLRTAMQLSSAFKNANRTFLSMICKDLDPVFYAPSDVIFMYGEDIIEGVSPCYLLLAGQVNIESKFGVTLGSIRAVEVFGEAAIQGGMGEKRSATVVAWEVGLVYVTRICGAGVAKAFEKFPEEKKKFIELYKDRQEQNVDVERNRRTWLKETAMPALVEQDIFGNCCTQFLWALATPLHESSYQSGQAIVNVGEAAHSMFIILRGEVAMESKNGKRMSVIRAQASFGELAVLGLLPTRTTTLRAISEVCVIEVTSLSLQHALSTKHAGKTGERFKQHVQARQDQVTLGMPLGVLNINTSPEDVSVSAVALHSQRIVYKTGEIMHPLPDDSPYGPRYSIVANGRCNLEMRTGRKVLTLVPGSIILEGIAAEFDAVFRATSTPCEIYQVYQNDFKIATSTVPEIHPWIWRFKVLEKQAKEELTRRLSNMHGLIEGLAPHASDEDIQAWSTRRENNIRLAKERRGRLEDEELLSDEEDIGKLPDITISPKASTSPSTILQGNRRLVKSQSMAPFAKAKNSESYIPLSTGLASYPTFHLPCLQQAESRFTKSARPLQRSSRSETMLRGPSASFR